MTTRHLTLSATLMAVLIAGGCARETSGDATSTVTAAPAAKSAEPMAAPKSAEPMAAPKPAAKSSSTMKSDDGSAANVIYLPTGDAASSALKVVTSLPSRVVAGESFTYKVTATNLTNVGLSDVVVKSSLTGPASVTSTSTPNAGSGKDMAFALGNLAGGASQTVTITAKVEDGEGALTSCATATFAQAACAQIPITVPLRIALTRSAPESVSACEPFAISYTVSNPSKALAKNVSVTETLPAGVTTVDGASSVRLSVPSLAAGESKTVTVNAKAAKAGSYSGKAGAAAETAPSVESAAGTTVVNEAALMVDVTVPEKAPAGRPFEAIAMVKNTSAVAAKDVTLRVPLSQGLSTVGTVAGGTVAADGVTFKVGDLAAGADKSFPIKLVYKTEVEGQFGVAATASAPCAKPANASKNLKAFQISALLLECVDTPDPLSKGDEVTYTISVTNQGKGNDKDVVIKASFEEGFKYLSSNGPTAGTLSGRDISFAPVANIDGGAKLTFTIKLKAEDTTGDFRFRVSMDSKHLGRPVEESESTQVF